MQVIYNSNQELQANLIIRHSSQVNSNTLLYSQTLVEVEANKVLSIKIVEKVGSSFQIPVTKAV